MPVFRTNATPIPHRDEIKLKKQLEPYEHTVYHERGLHILVIRSPKPYPDMVNDLERMKELLEAESLTGLTHACLIGDRETVGVSLGLLRELVATREQDEAKLIDELRGRVRRDHGLIYFESALDPSNLLRLAVSVPERERAIAERGLETVLAHEAVAAQLRWDARPAVVYLLADDGTLRFHGDEVREALECAAAPLEEETQDGDGAKREGGREPSDEAPERWSMELQPLEDWADEVAPPSQWRDDLERSDANLDTDLENEIDLDLEGDHRDTENENENEIENEGKRNGTGPRTGSCRESYGRRHALLTAPRTRAQTQTRDRIILTPPSSRRSDDTLDAKRNDQARTLAMRAEVVRAALNAAGYRVDDAPLEGVDMIASSDAMRVAPLFIRITESASERETIEFLKTIEHYAHGEAPALLLAESFEPGLEVYTVGKRFELANIDEFLAGGGTLSEDLIA